MTDAKDPTKPLPEAEKFAPKNVAGDDDHGRATREMDNLSRGSEKDIRNKSGNRIG